MKMGEIAGMAIFGLLVLGALVVAIRQGATERKQVAGYAAGHGFPLLDADDVRLAALLAQVDPEAVWRPHFVMLVEPPHGVYLFSYQTRPKDSNAKSTNGYACLAERDSHRPQSPMAIFPRTPGIEILVPHKVAAGGVEFRQKFTVTSRNADEAMRTVNGEVEWILLEHRTGPGWYLTVNIAGPGVLVASRWAEKEEEWDYLIALARKVRVAVR